MALLRFKEAYPDYRQSFKNTGNSEAAHFDEYSVYSGNDKVGSIKDALFDQNSGSIRYLIVDTGFWIFGKDVLLPIGLARFDYDQRRVYVDGLTKDQVENLPEYRDDMTIDREYEDRVRNSYRDLGVTRSSRYQGRAKEYNTKDFGAYPGSAALYGAKQYGSSSTTSQSAMNTTASTGAAKTGAAANMAARNTAAGTNRYDNDYDYDTEPGLYGMDRDYHQPIRLYQERLIADKERFKTGSVRIGKHVVTETQEASVPVEKERVVIERHQPTSTTPTNQSPDFREGEVARVDVYSEKANIRKEAFVREEVDIRKEVDRDTVTERKEVRREELDVDSNDNPDVLKR